MSNLSLAPPECNYHVQAVDFRGGVERNVCCESSRDVAVWLVANGFRWTERGFIRDAAGHHGKPLYARVLRGGPYGAGLAADEQRETILPHFAAE